MSEQNKVNESVNLFLAGLKGVPGISLPDREVLPAETAEQIDDLKGQLVKRDETITSLAKEVEDLKAVIESHKAEKANAERLTKVQTKAFELTKDLAFADVVLADVTEASADKSFDDTKVEALITKLVAKYEKVAKATAKPNGSLNTEDLGRDFSDEDFNELDDQPEDEQSEDTEQQPKAGRSKVLETTFGGRKKK